MKLFSFCHLILSSSLKTRYSLLSLYKLQIEEPKKKKEKNYRKANKKFYFLNIFNFNKRVDTKTTGQISMMLRSCILIIFVHS